MGTTQISNKSLVKSFAYYIRLYSLTFKKKKWKWTSLIIFVGTFLIIKNFGIFFFFCGDRKSYHCYLHMQSITWIVFLFDVMYCVDYTDL